MLDKLSTNREALQNFQNTVKEHKKGTGTVKFFFLSSEDSGHKNYEQKKGARLFLPFLSDILTRRLLDKFLHLSKLSVGEMEKMPGTQLQE